MRYLVRNATWGAFSAAMRAATGLFIALFAVRLLGGESYGQMVTLHSLFVVYLALNSSVCTVLVTRLMRAARAEPGCSDESILTAASLLTLLSLVVLVLLTILLWGVVSVISTLTSRGSDSIDAISQGVILMGVLTAVQIINALHSAVIEAAGRLDLAMKRQMAGQLAVTVILLLLLISKTPVSIPGYMVVLCFGAMLDLLLLSAVRQRLIPSKDILRFSPGIRQEIVQLLKSGTTLQAASLMGIFLEPLNKFLLSHYIGALAVTAYDLTMKLIWGIQSLFAGGMRVFLHLAHEQGNIVSDVFYRVIALVLVPALALHVFAAVFLTWMVHHWVMIGDTVQIMIFFALATVSNLGMIYITPFYISLIGRSDLNFIFRSQSIVAITNIVASIVLIPFFGLLGAVFGLLCATAYNVAAIYRRHERVVGVGIGVSAVDLIRSGRFIFTVMLFCCAILMGMGHADIYFAAGIILLAMTYVMKSEPLSAMLYARVKKSGTACPGCGSRALLIGPIPGSNSFAGRQLDRVLPGGKLWRCSACNLVFRYPRLAKESLDELYREGHSDSWSEPAGDRADWQLVKKILAEHPNLTRVLDVGCFDERLLDLLGSKYEKLGIEIHEKAVRRAEKRSVKVIGRDFDKLPVVQGGVDAVLAMDVIEHTENPMAFLTKLAGIVRPGGLILIGTGNSHALTWRLMGSAYWYCHIAEHISFINPRWVDYAVRKLGLDKVALHSFSHGGGHVRQRAREATLNIFYRMSPTLFARFRQLGAGHIDLSRFPELSKVPPYWLTATDHFLIVLRKR